MKLYLELDLRDYSDTALEADLKQLPRQRYDKAMRFQTLPNRKCCVRTYMLLWNGLRQEYGVDEAPVFAYETNGKPYLPYLPEIHFSLSHTRNAALCVIDTHPIGADIETLRPRGMQHLLPCFPATQREKIMNSDRPELAFAQIWTRAESYLKLTGEGLTGIECLRRIPVADTELVHFTTVVREKEGLVYSTCQWRSSHSNKYSVLKTSETGEVGHWEY